MILRALGSALALAFVLLCAPRVAHAGDVEDFETARSAYEARDYERAVIYFQELVGGERPRLESRALVAEARKYLGAAYLFVGRRDAARDQFERLLRADPEYLLDPLRFPVDVQELFDSVRERLTVEARDAAIRDELSRRAEHAEARARALLTFAEAERPVEIPNSRWLALLPLGVGQFQNEDPALGWTFLLSEVALGGLALGAAIWWQDVAAFATTAQAAGAISAVEEANRQLAIAFPLHWGALGGLALVALAGIVEAQLSFRPARVVIDRRSAPEELREGIADDSVVDLEIGLGVGQISANLRF